MAPWKQTANNGTKTEIPPAGSHPAVCVALIDLGTHTDTVKDDKGVEKQKDFRRILIVWELTAEKIAGLKDENHVIARDFNVSFSSKSKLRPMVEKWRGKVLAEGEDFDLAKLLGQSCLLTVTHGKSARGNDFAKFDGASPVPKGMAVPKPQRKPLLWDVAEAELPDLSWVPFLYGDPVRDVINRSHERKGLRPAAADAHGTTEEQAEAAF
jgi:hypothetical protein